MCSRLKQDVRRRHRCSSILPSKIRNGGGRARDKAFEMSHLVEELYHQLFRLSKPCVPRLALRPLDVMRCNLPFILPGKWGGGEGLSIYMGSIPSCLSQLCYIVFQRLSIRTHTHHHPTNLGYGGVHLCWYIALGSRGMKSHAGVRKPTRVKLHIAFFELRSGYYSSLSAARTYS